jgi:hypothetical protein
MFFIKYFLYFSYLLFDNFKKVSLLFNIFFNFFQIVLYIYKYIYIYIYIYIYLGFNFNLINQ